MSQSLFSIVVPTRNRGEIIGECLKLLLAQTYRPLEIIVLDQSTNALTRAACAHLASAAFDASISFDYVNSTRCGLDAARNAGCSTACGLAIGFVDDDCLVEKQWAEAMVHEFDSDPAIGMVFGQTRPYYPPQPGRRTNISVQDTSDRQAFESRWSVLWRSAGAGNNMAIRRDVLAAVGPFDERLGVGTKLPGGDETEMTYRVLKQGFKVIYTPSAKSYHKRWLPEDQYLRVEHGYYIGKGAAISKHCRRFDVYAALMLAVEGVGRLAEIPYHALVTRQPDNVTRAIWRAKGFYKGFAVGWREFAQQDVQQ